MVEGTTAHRENKAVVDRLLRELDKLQRSARPSKTMAKRCRKARINVQSHFKLARRKVRSEKGEGHAKFRQHRDYIDRYFGREEPGHAVQIRNMQNAIDNCSRVLRLEPR